jgi:phosphatidylglycerophosphate synthase
LSYLSQYKESLKAVEVEEIFDLIVFRPLAFIFVKLTYRYNLTPDMVSVVALITGCVAGVMFAFGEYLYLVAGACLYFISNVLDCADGQIARLKKNGTKVGRIIDGVVDYFISIFVFAGISVGMTVLQLASAAELRGNMYLNWNPFAYIWILGIIAGISSAIQAFYFDFYRNKFLEIVYGKVSNILDEVKEYEEEQRMIKSGEKKANIFEKFLINVYLKYSRLQVKIQKEHEVNTSREKPPAELYYIKNKLLLRLWSWIGSTTHITLCIICALLNDMELFLLICILPFNLLMIILFFIQKSVNRQLS